MPLLRTDDPTEAQQIVRRWQNDGLTVGFVPTMGALHEGHLSLVRASAAECERSVMSVYVNPTQFAPEEDLEEYPRQLDQDCRLAERQGVDMVFHPTDQSMYPNGFCTYVTQQGLTETLEGRLRPMHFRGVLTVVCKLLHIVPADRAYFGRKDFQQTVVVRRMVRDLNMSVSIRVLPTVREDDGLALSSRNSYLNADERVQARVLYRALTEAVQRHRRGQTDPIALRAVMCQIIKEAPLAGVDYVEIVDQESLAPVETVDEGDIALLAVRIGKTRLIDNMPFAQDTE